LPRAASGIALHLEQVQAGANLALSQVLVDGLLGKKQTLTFRRAYTAHSDAQPALIDALAACRHTCERRTSYGAYFSTLNICRQLQITMWKTPASPRTCMRTSDKQDSTGMRSWQVYRPAHLCVGSLALAPLPVAVLCIWETCQHGLTGCTERYSALAARLPWPN